MTTKYVPRDKRTWFRAINKERIEKIADSIPEEKANAVIEYMSRWLNIEKRDQSTKNNRNKNKNNMCRFHNICPLYYPCHTCGDDIEASTYCGKFRELERKR